MKQRCLGCMAEYESTFGICPYCGYVPDTAAENPLHLQPGTQLEGRYTIGRVLGYGGFGVAYIAFDNVLNQKVAIKEYLPSEFATRMSGNCQVSVFSGNKAEQFADGMLKFMDEAKRLAKFQSADGIVRVFDSFEANETAYITMEYLEGETLTAYLDRTGKISPEQAVTLLEPVAHSLEAVHQAGIIHRDIAPDNIFLTSDGRVKLIDFGAARYATTSHSRSLTVIIKAGYSPEEQYRSLGDQGPHTDVYALAAVLYRMVTGATPPDALERRATLENRKRDILLPPSKFCKIDSNLENAILNAMNVRIEDRTPSVQIFWEELTSDSVKRHGNRVQALNLAQWPLGLKIAIPALGVAALTLLVLLLTGIIGPESILAGSITMEDGMTRVPSVINCSVGDAQELLNKKQLNSLVSGRRQSDVIPAGMVLSQSVDAGQVVEVDTQVELYVSEQMDTQPESGHVPDVMYYAEADAVEAFRQLGVEPKLEYTYSSDVPEGLVVEQSVTGGDELPQGAEVVLTISRGPDPTQESAEPEETQNSTTSNLLNLNHTSLSLNIGNTATLSVSGGSGNYLWSSSNNSVATVRGGTVTAVNSGQAVITVSSGTKTASCSVTVQAAQKYSMTLNSSIIANVGGFSKLVGDTEKLTVSGVPANSAITWSSSDNSVATVQNGLVTAVGVGEAIITAQATYEGESYEKSCYVGVRAREFYLNPTSAIMGTGQSISLFFPDMSGRDVSDVTWSSSDPSVAAVSPYRVTALKAGSATITAQVTIDGEVHIGTCQVTVVESETEEPIPESTKPFWEEDDFDYEKYLDDMWGPLEN